jgi:hypothetical protein
MVDRAACQNCCEFLTTTLPTKNLVARLYALCCAAIHRQRTCVVEVGK